MRDALVFGGSGQIGAPLLAGLRAAGWRVFAVSRSEQIDDASVRWLRGDLVQFARQPTSVDAIFSCGPLDHFARWYAASQIDAARVIAFGSTSLQVKSDSADPLERVVAARLVEGEGIVFATAARRGVNATLLRPTLVYGAGRDRTLTRIAAFARRWGRFVLPDDACGLRQPVHVDDLATAALHACEAVASFGGVYALPGGETVSYREMVARVLATLQPAPRLIEVPPPLFSAALWSAQKLGLGAGFGDAAVARLRSDLVFDAAPAQQHFAYAARPFLPTTQMFSAS